MDIAVTLAKNHEQSLVIDVPVTAISNATGFDGYQVIVMPSENRPIEEEPTKFSSSGPGNVEISVVNSYAKKAAAMRQNRLQLQCSHCDYKCLTPDIRLLKGDATGYSKGGSWPITGAESCNDPYLNICCLFYR